MTTDRFRSHSQEVGRGRVEIVRRTGKSDLVREQFIARVLPVRGFLVVFHIVEMHPQRGASASGVAAIIIGFRQRLLFKQDNAHTICDTQSATNCYSIVENRDAGCCCDGGRPIIRPAERTCDRDVTHQNRSTGAGMCVIL